MSSYRDGDQELHLGLASDARPMKRCRTSSEGNPPPLISKLADDLLVEILIRGLQNPRFACWGKLVCKRWSSLISSQCFNCRFVAHHRSRSAEETPSSISSFLPVPDEIRPFSRVFDSFKDLILCGFARFDVKTNGELGRSYLICNPFTKQWIALPLAPEKSAAEYTTLVARLVCEPRIAHSLDRGDGQPPFVYSEYRFRVVCIYELGMSTKLDVFCSESGKWSKEALVLHGYSYSTLPRPKAKSCNGKLFWAYSSLDDNGIVEFNPFRFDIAPTFIHDDALFRRPASSWGFSVSHGALHVIQLETEATPGCSRNALIIWRLEDNRRSWRIQCEVLLRTTWPNGVSRYIELDLHPERPDTALLTFSDYDGMILSCDLKSGELEHFSTQRAQVPGWMLFQPRVSCWPTPIPSYNILRGMYDGHYCCWVQNSSNEATTSSVTAQCELVDGVEQIGQQMKDNISRLVLDAFGLEQARQTIRDVQARLENINKRINGFVVQSRETALSAAENYDMEFLLVEKHIVTRYLQIATARHEVISRLHRNLPLYPVNLGLPGGGQPLLAFPAAAGAGDHVDGGQ